MTCKPNVIWKLACKIKYIVKLMEVWYFLRNSRIQFFKIGGSIVKNMERIELIQEKGTQSTVQCSKW